MKSKQRRDRRGRVLRTAAQRQELVRAWRASGITQAQFCAQRNIHPTTFSTWCRAAVPKALGGSDGATKAGIEFAEIKMAVCQTAPIEVLLTNGVAIRLRDAALCRELLPVCMQICGGNSAVLRELSC